jgi:hypothetical protein
MCFNNCPTISMINLFWIEKDQFWYRYEANIYWFKFWWKFNGWNNTICLACHIQILLNNTIFGIVGGYCHVRIVLLKWKSKLIRLPKYILSKVSSNQIILRIYSFPYKKYFQFFLASILGINFSSTLTSLCSKVEPSISIKISNCSY